MKNDLLAVLCLSLGSVGVARAEAGAPSTQQTIVRPPQPPPPVQPPTAAPTEMPPAPPEQPPPPPRTQNQADEQEPVLAGADATANGQWVYTDQYGWVFMPYGDQYTAEGTVQDDYPYAYLY